MGSFKSSMDYISEYLKNIKGKLAGIFLGSVLAGMLESLAFISSIAKISHGGAYWRQEDSKFKVILDV